MFLSFVCCAIMHGMLTRSFQRNKYGRKYKKECTMSVLIDFAIFPTDKEISVSPYVARVVRIIRESGLACRLGPMGTSVEGEWAEVMDLVNRCFEELQRDSDRVYLTLRADYRKGASGRLEGKVKSVEEKIGTLPPF